MGLHAARLDDRPADRNATRLRCSFSGEVLVPGDPGYDTSRRVWNGSIDRRPGLIARCRSTADVVAALRFGTEQGLAIAVRGGGHSFPGFSVCDEGIVIDLRSMNEIHVDTDQRTVRARAGVLLGELDRATQAHGLAVPLGSVTHTGLAGLTLGGGFGWLMRRHGLAIDQLLSVELVTAAGDVVRANAQEHPDLFWAVRGGGGNFGIVTEFEYRLNAVGPQVLSSLLLWPLDEAPHVAQVYRDWAASAPDELTTALVLRPAPALDQVPRELHGRPVIGVASLWAGSIGPGERILDPMRRHRPPWVDLTTIRPYTEHQGMFDSSFPSGIWVYSKAADVRALEGDVIDLLLDQAGRIESARSGIIAWQLGGAVSRVGELDTPFGSRASGYLVDILGATDAEPGFDRERAWARDAWAALAPHRAGAYVNWLMDEGEARVREAYGAERYARLKAVKRQYDPRNTFRLNQNISPD